MPLLCAPSASTYGSTEGIRSVGQFVADRREGTYKAARRGQTGGMDDGLRRDSGEHADERHREAHLPEAGDDEREALADSRDDAADERERQADRRERLADRRESLLDARERGLDQWERIAGLPPAGSALQAALEPTARARASMRAGEARLSRTDAALARESARDRREQRAVAREMEATLRRSRDAVSSAGSEAEVERLKDLVHRAAEALATAQDTLAAHHEALADDRTHSGAAHRGNAERAREEARRTRVAAGLIAGTGTDEDA